MQRHRNSPARPEKRCKKQTHTAKRVGLLAIATTAKHGHHNTQSQIDAGSAPIIAPPRKARIFLPKHSPIPSSSAVMLDPSAALQKCILTGPIDPPRSARPIVVIPSAPLQARCLSHTLLALTEKICFLTTNKKMNKLFYGSVIFSSSIPTFLSFRSPS